MAGAIGGDFRGYLYNLAKGGDQNASAVLNFVGNDYDGSGVKGIDAPRLAEYAGGVTGQDSINNQNAYRNYLQSAYNTYSGLGGASTDQARQAGGSKYDAALYDQAIANIQASQATLDQQRGIGLANISGDYQNNLNRLLNARNQTENTYNTNKVTSEQDNQKARSNVDFETGQRANALQRLLGSKGAGSSSAARFAAPYAAALEGTQQLNQVGDAYQKNMAGLDTSWTNYMTDYGQKKDDLEAQKINAERSLEADVVGKRQTLLQQLAQLQAQRASAIGGNPVAASQGSFDQANALSGQINELGRQYFGRVNVADPTYKAPDLAKYDYDARSQIGVANNAQQSVSPYLSVLLNAQKERKQNQIV